MKFIVFVIYIAVLVQTSKTKNNNVCLRLRDYNTKLFNNNCWYNPDVDHTTIEIIKNHGYPLETYEIETDDGYILPLYRIPHGKTLNKNKTSQPVFLQHGIFSSSAAWIANDNESIGFILADQGYDVWLGNSRGNTYGKGHILYTSHDMQFWNFSYHEMAIYDTPAFLNKIYETTNKKTIMIGHSMGVNIQVVYASEFPEHAKGRVKFMIHLASVAFMINVKIPLAPLAPLWPILEKFSKVFHIGELLPKYLFPIEVMNMLCFQLGLTAAACEYFFIFYLVSGIDFINFPPKTVPVFFGHFPAGTSVKTLVHLAQAISSRKFARYDYGHRLNQKYYNSTNPPSYNLSKVEIPGIIIYGSNDWLSPEDSSLVLYKALPKNNNSIYKITDPTFNHLDFFFSRNIVPALIDKLLEVMDKYRTTM